MLNLDTAPTQDKPPIDPRELENLNKPENVVFPLIQNVLALYKDFEGLDIHKLEVTETLLLLNNGIYVEEIKELYASDKNMRDLSREVTASRQRVFDVETQKLDIYYLDLYFGNALGYLKLTGDPYHMTQALTYALDNVQNRDRFGDQAWYTSLLYINSGLLSNFPLLETILSTYVIQLNRETLHSTTTRDFYLTTKLAARRLLGLPNKDIGPIVDPVILSTMQHYFSTRSSVTNSDGLDNLPYINTFRVLLADSIAVDFQNGTYTPKFLDRSTLIKPTSPPPIKEFEPYA